MGATASTVQTYNEVVSCRKRGETFIPLNNLTEHLRLFQHHTGGDILILVDKDATAFLADPTSSEYQEIFISRRGTEYLDQMKVALVAQANKALGNPGNSTKSASGRIASEPKELPLVAGVPQSSELTLYQTHQLQNPQMLFKYSDPLSNHISLSSSSKEANINPPQSGDKRERDRPLRGSVSFAESQSEDVEAGASSFSSSTVNTPSISEHFSNRPGLGGLARGAGEHGMVYSQSAGHLGRSADPEGDPSILSAFSSLSKSNDPLLETSRNIAMLPSSSAAAKDFQRHEQEMLHRARLLEADNEARVKAITTTIGGNYGIASAPDDRADSKREMSSPRLLPRLSPRTSSVVSQDSAGTLNSPPGPNLAASSTSNNTPRSLGRADSKESKDSKESSEPHVRAPIPMRKFVPMAYLPPSTFHRDRIAKEDKREQNKPQELDQRYHEAGRNSEASSLDYTSRTASREVSRMNSFQADEKHDGVDGVISHLTPRSLGMVSAESDRKSISLRTTVYGGEIHSSVSNVSHITSNAGGIASMASASDSARKSAVVSCPVCGHELKNCGNARDAELFERHVNSCTMRKQMKSILASIDQNLVPKLDELADSNRKQLSIALSAVIGRVADEFDQTSAAHTAVKKIVTSVLRINYDTSKRKIDRTEEALKGLLDRVMTEINEAQLMQAHGSTEAIRKITAFNNLSRILDQTAEKLAQKRHNITLYKKYLVGIQDFKVLRKLGKGAFASVYLARVADTKQLCAMKVLGKAEVLAGQLMDQVMKERTAMVMASRYPDYFVQLQFAFQSKDELFLVMEYMHGGDCLSLLSSVKRLPEHVAQHFIAQVCMAVMHLHAHGVIHRDIKPDNVMITSRGHAKLGDFGSVCPIHPDFRTNQKQPKEESSFALQSLASRSDSQHQLGSPGLSSAGGATLSPSKLGAGQKTNFAGSMSQLSSEITAMASLAFRKTASKSSSSYSNSLWLDEDPEAAPLQTVQERESSSASWSDGSSSSSSLFFNKVRGGPVMQNTFDIVGNYFYASPEMAGGTCILNQAVDWWAVGVLMFHMLTGTTPFEGLTKASTLENIENKLSDWEALPEEISGECRDFLHAFLGHNYETRLGTAGAEEVLSHQFFANLDFATLYDDYGPYYPRPPMASDESNPDFYSFSALSEEEGRNVPSFYPQDSSPLSSHGGPKKLDAKDCKETDEEDQNISERTSDGPALLLGRQLRPVAGSPEDEIFQDFDFHPV